MCWEISATGFFAALASLDGDAALAESLLAQLDPGATLGWATYHLARRDLDQCADLVLKAIEQRDPRVTYMIPHLRTSSRWPALAKILNLPDPAVGTS